MRPEKSNLVAIAALSALQFATAEEGGVTLSDFQRVLRTSLEGELEKMEAGSRSVVHDEAPAAEREMHTKRRSNVRRRIAYQAEHEHPRSVSSSHDASVFAEHAWDQLMRYAWNAARTIQRKERGGLTVTPNPDEAHLFPFLVCTRRGQDGYDNSVGSVEDMVALFDKQYYDGLTVSSSRDETCVILTVPAWQVQENVEGNPGLVAVPLLDIAKIHAGTIDEVSSQGWSVPFVEQMAEQGSISNETEAIAHWERILVVDFVPGLGGGGLKEESELLDVVNGMMGDIQDMGEVGWLRSMDKAEAEGYLVEESLVGVPALSDMFSLTSSLVNINSGGSDNPRIKFWRDALKRGIESEHACSEMFSVLFVKPRAGYYGYDLVLNPADGPPPQEYESSAANPACVTSLIAALSTHPYVLSVKANFPIYHGWNVAQKLDTL
ncbi:hypothetical protein ACHAXT_010321 [Thalassiosira profunda]